MMMSACSGQCSGRASARRRPIRTIGFGTTGLIPAIWLYACAVRPPPPPPLTLPPVSRAIRPAPTAAPAAGHLVKASWYGPGLVGKRTTSGERFNPRALTAASKTIPLGSVVKVTNPDNGKSVKVRINDRGPFVRGRSLDLSPRAAEKIGIIKKGVVRVRVTPSTATVRHGMRPRPEPPASSDIRPVSSETQ